MKNTMLVTISIMLICGASNGYGNNNTAILNKAGAMLAENEKEAEKKNKIVLKEEDSTKKDNNIEVTPGVIEERDNKTGMIRATAGKEFVITLAGNATTGYEWQIASPIDKSLIDLVSSGYTPDNTGRVGSGGKAVWTFKALRAGQARISFKYIRPWEKDTPPVGEVTYLVVVDE